MPRLTLAIALRTTLLSATSALIAGVIIETASGVTYVNPDCVLMHPEFLGPTEETLEPLPNLERLRLVAIRETGGIAACHVVGENPHEHAAKHAIRIFGGGRTRPVHFAVYSIDGFRRQFQVTILGSAPP